MKSIATSSNTIVLDMVLETSKKTTYISNLHIVER